jgi:PmbA protein
MDLLTLARDVVSRARALGANEATASASRGTEVSLVRRAGKLEQASQATSQSVSLSLLVDDRFSTHATSDLRPDALQAFLERAIAATRVLEPEPERRQAPLSDCGIGASEESLQSYDSHQEALSAEARRLAAEALEAEVDALPERARILSATMHVGDSRSEGARVMSNGFEGRHRSTGFGLGVEMTLEEGDGRRPEGYAFYSTLHAGDLPGNTSVAREAWERTAARLASGPAPSGRYPMLLENRVVGRILGVLGGPLSGAELHQGRSFLADKKGERIASPLLTLVDDPTIPRGLGSRSFDSDGFAARRMDVLTEGVLQNYYVNLYYGRKLGMTPTTGGRSNWVVAPGTESPEALVRDLPRCIHVTGFLGGNSNGLTGDFSFGVQGVLLEHGQPVKNLSEMNVSGHILEVLQHIVAVGNDTWTYSGLRSPSVLFEDVSFSGT